MDGNNRTVTYRESAFIHDGKLHHDVLHAFPIQHICQVTARDGQCKKTIRVSPVTPGKQRVTPAACTEEPAPVKPVVILPGRIPAGDAKGIGPGIYRPLNGQAACRGSKIITGICCHSQVVAQSVFRRIRSYRQFNFRLAVFRHLEGDGLVILQIGGFQCVHAGLEILWQGKFTGCSPKF